MNYPLYFDSKFAPICFLLKIQQDSLSFRYSAVILDKRKFFDVTFGWVQVLDCVDTKNGFHQIAENGLSKSDNMDICITYNNKQVIMNMTHLGMLLYKHKVQYKTYDITVPEFTKHRLITSHMPFINRELVVFEFELETHKGWNNLTMAFAYNWIVSNLFTEESGTKTNNVDGLYNANESRMIDIVHNKRCLKMGETALASFLYNLIR
jgi:hypothetical protein